MATKIIETPRDAMQGIAAFIPTEKKIDYLNSLLAIGFNEIDFSSFVSPRAIPQLSDSSAVIEKLNLENTSSRIMATIGNLGGGERALQHSKIDSLAFPFSISEIFLKKNIRSNFIKGSQTIRDLLSLCQENNKELIVYIAMAFGNPYGDNWNIDILRDWTMGLKQMGVKTIMLADTTGDGTCQGISDSFIMLNKEFNEYRAEDVAKFELEIVRRKLDDFKKIPESDRPQWVADSIERLKRQEQRLEDKLDKLSS